MQICYKAKDGQIFDNQEDAIHHETKIDLVRRIIAVLGEKDFHDGRGYIQHKPFVVNEVKSLLWELTRPYIQYIIDSTKKEKGYTDEQIKQKASPAWVSGSLDGSYPELERAWNRMLCIDDEYREWGQPFFALNPDERKYNKIR